MEEQGAWGRSRGARVESKNTAWVRISSGQVDPGDVERVFGGRWSWAEETETYQPPRRGAPLPKVRRGGFHLDRRRAEGSERVQRIWGRVWEKRCVWIRGPRTGVPGVWCLGSWGDEGPGCWASGLKLGTWVTQEVRDLPGNDPFESELGKGDSSGKSWRLKWENQVTRVKRGSDCWC